jgi:hypothetical protein
MRRANLLTGWFFGFVASIAASPSHADCYSARELSLEEPLHLSRYYEWVSVSWTEKDRSTGQDVDAIGLYAAPLRIFFGPGSAHLTDEARKALELQIWDIVPGLNTVHIEASADDIEVPDEATAEVLALARAQAVRDYLVSLHVPAEQITGVCSKGRDRILALPPAERTREVRRHHRMALTVFERFSSLP